MYPSIGACALAMGVSQTSIKHNTIIKSFFKINKILFTPFFTNFYMLINMLQLHPCFRSCVLEICKSFAFSPRCRDSEGELYMDILRRLL